VSARETCSLSLYDFELEKFGEEEVNRQLQKHMMSVDRCFGELEIGMYGIDVFRKGLI